MVSGRLIYINSEVNVIKAAILMRKHNISSLLVKHKGDFTGIVTEKDIINKVVAEELYPGDITVSDIMSKELITVLQDERIVGIITETDITKHLKSIAGSTS